LNAVEIIIKKRNGLALSGSEIGFFINSYIKGLIEDYQMSSFLMAVYLNGMNDDETLALTEAMLESGEKIEYPLPDDIYVDKHSTGGVGDKVSLILAPLLAACGAKVPMLSGRGLGHTGGTLDKLESIPGFRTDLTPDEIRDGLEKVGCIITGQTENLAPADRMMYALRDVAGTVESIPLICGSILSKKFAAGPRGIVFDIKCGNGAFMRDMESARNLGENLIRISHMMGRKAGALITDMNQPLGCAVGNRLEVMECIEFLKGDRAEDLYRVTVELGAQMLFLAGIEKDRKKAVGLLETKLRDGSAWGKFQQMVEYQKGDLSDLLNWEKISHEVFNSTFKARQDGYLQAYCTYEIGRLVNEMGGGRRVKNDVIDPMVGFKFFKKIGDEMVNDDTVAEIHAKDKNQAARILEKLGALIKMGTDKPFVPELIKERIS
jgi:pyrimidine-nucleoside phosphorylase